MSFLSFLSFGILIAHRQILGVRLEMVESCGTYEWGAC